MLAGVLFELSPTPPIFFTSTLAILSIAAFRSICPGPRPARIDPVAALKYE
jgi:hypothetical protein